MKTLFDSPRAIVWLFVFFSFVSSKADDLSSGLYCPPDHWVNCGDELWDLSIYGYARLVTYSGTQYLYYPQVSHHLNSCNIGYIKRTWHVQDPYGKWHHCAQHIYVGSGSSNYHAPTIVWPHAELELHGCNPHTHPDYLPYGYDYPKHWTNSDCSLIGMSYNDQEYYIQGGCKKVIRNWQIIDWCQYDPNDGYDTGIWRYTQVIKIMNNDIPDVITPPDITVETTDCERAYVHIYPLRTHDSDCDFSGNITNNSIYAFQNGADASGNYPVGTTTVRFSVDFGCSGKEYFYADITVVDNSTPVPVCHGLNTTLMPIFIDGDSIPDGGMIEIWASDLNNHSYGACGKNDLRYSFSSDITDRVRTFTCEHLGDNEIEMWVTDDSGNQAYCNVIIHIQNNNESIPDCQNADDPDDTEETTEEETEEEEEGSISFTGNVFRHYDNEPIADVDIELTGIAIDTSFNITYDTVVSEIVIDSFYNSSGTLIFLMEMDTTFSETKEIIDVNDRIFNQKTGVNGNYSFTNLSQPHEFMITARKLDPSDENISSMDLQVLLDHVTGDKLITDPYALLAADLDESGDIDSDDFTILFDYLAGNRDGLPSYKPWVFVDADYVFRDNIPVFDQGSAFYRLTGMLDAPSYVMNFVAILKGDIVGMSNAHVATRSNSDIFQMYDALFSSQLTTLEVSASPNPFVNGTTFSISNPTDQLLTIKIHDVNGKLIKEEVQSFSKGQQKWSVDLEQNLRAGIYFYELKGMGGILKGKLFKVE